MKILVIGGTNFIGLPVVRRLSVMGHEVTVFHQELGYSEPVLQEEALRQTIAWERKHPPDEISKWAAPELLDYTSEDAILASLKRNNG